VAEISDNVVMIETQTETVHVGPHTLLRGDCLPLMLSMPPRSFDVVVADPPYCSAIRGGSQKQSSAKKYVTSDAARQFEEFAGDGRDQRSFLLWCTLWLGAAHRLTADGGAALIFCDYRNLSAMIDAVQSGGFIFDGVIPWIKSNSRPRMGWYQTSRVEYVIVGRRGSTVADGFPRKLGPSHVTGMAPTRRVHPTQKPVGTIRQLIELRADWLRVLDPFAGVGSTVLAGDQIGRSVTAIEMTDHYFGLMAETVRQQCEPVAV
jgi:site-specific DNA-methyltransferase (adenine-specific)